MSRFSPLIPSARALLALALMLMAVLAAEAAADVAAPGDDQGPVLAVAAAADVAAAGNGQGGLGRPVTATTDLGETVSGFVGEPLAPPPLADDAAIAAAAAAADAADAAGAAAIVASGDDGSSAGGPAVAAMSSIYGGILSQHNSYRSRHISPALVWNDAVADRAKITVDSCRFAHNGQVRIFGARFTPKRRGHHD